MGGRKPRRCQAFTQIKPHPDQRKSNSSSDSDDKACITKVEKGMAMAASTRSSIDIPIGNLDISAALDAVRCTDHYES